MVINIKIFSYQFMYTLEKKYNTKSRCQLNTKDNTKLIQVCRAQMTPVWYDELADDPRGRGSIGGVVSFQPCMSNTSGSVAVDQTDF